MPSVDRANASTPAFSLRFERGRGRLVLASPHPVEVEDPGGRRRPIARLASLELDLGALHGGLRLRGGWSTVRTFRTELVSLTIDVDLAELSALGRGPRVLVEGVSEAGSELRILVREAERAIALEACPRWRDADLVLAVRDVRATARRERSALADVLDALRPIRGRLDRDAGVLVVPQPLRSLLAEALLPLGMRIPAARGLLVERPRVVVDGRGRALLRIDAGASAELSRALGRGGLEAREAARVEALHVEARRLGALTLALAEGRTDGARRELEARRATLAPERAAELEAACALEDDEGVEGDAATRGEALLPALLEVRSAARRLGRGGDERDELERALDRWLAREPSDTFAALELLGLAEGARSVDAEASRALARRAAGYVARLSITSASDETTLAERVLELTEGQLPRALVEELLPALGVARWVDSTLALSDAGLPAIGAPAAIEDASLEDVRPATALALDAIGRPELADRAWERLREDDDPRVARLVAARDERRGERLRALEGWARAAELAAAAREATSARRASIRAASLARSLGLDEVARAHVERALDASGAMSVEDTLALANLVRGARWVELSARVEALVLAAASGERGARADVVGTIEELFDWALERGATSRARALRDALVRARPDRAELTLLPSEPAMPEAPRAKAERLRAEGRLDEAARVLFELGREERDAATSRAALDLAERSGDATLAIEIIELLLAWVGEGPARQALTRRRQRLEGPR